MIDDNKLVLRQNFDFVDNLIKYSGRESTQTDIDNNYIIVNKDNTFKLKLAHRKRLKPSNRIFIIRMLSHLTQMGINNYSNQPLMFELKDYAECRGISINKAREKIKDDINALYDMSIELVRTNKYGKEQSKIEFRILEAKAHIKMNKIYLFFTDKFLQFYKSIKTVMPLPIELFGVLVKENPNTFDLFMKLLLHYNTNQNKENKNKNILNVKTLLEYCSAIPKYDDSMKKTGGIRVRIINPFIRDMNAINIIEWYFLDNKNNKITIDDIKYYDDFVNLKVCWHWKRDVFSEKIA